MPPVVSGVPERPLRSQTVALDEVEGVLPVRVVSGLQLLSVQVLILIQATQQKILMLATWGLAYLTTTHTHARRYTHTETEAFSFQ